MQTILMFMLLTQYNSKNVLFPHFKTYFRFSASADTFVGFGSHPRFYASFARVVTYRFLVSSICALMCDRDWSDEITMLSEECGDYEALYARPIDGSSKGSRIG